MIDVTDVSFESDVLSESMNRPVIVDLWAPWCGPCRTLGPLIEKVVAETDGAVQLAKINVDENPGASQAFQVQSIPAVYALRDGQIVDGFMGAKPEAEIREFVQEFLPPAEEDSDQSLLDASDDESLEQVVEDDPIEQEDENASAQLRLAELLDLVKSDDDARSEFVELLEVLGPEHSTTAEWRRRLSTKLY